MWVSQPGNLGLIDVILAPKIIQKPRPQFRGKEIPIAEIDENITGMVPELRGVSGQGGVVTEPLQGQPHPHRRGFTAANRMALAVIQVLQSIAKR